jgi:cytochrome c biogenesis protein CcdA
MFEQIPDLLATYPLIAFGLVFAAGVVSSASPCALATVPLVVGYVGGHTSDLPISNIPYTNQRRRAFFYSLAFVLGLASTFTALGAAAALLGQLMGNIGGPWFIALGLLAAAMGLHLIGWLPLRLPTLPHWQPKVAGPLGALLLGALFGIVSSPCATPVLVALLGLVATQGEVTYGIALLFVYALGHCVLMLAAGTFAGLVSAWAKSRGMMAFSARLKQGMGLLLVAAGGYLIWLA